MSALRFVLVVAWMGLLALTLRATDLLGSAASALFIIDFRHPWRATFNTDFSIHVLLLAWWVIWREKSRTAGILCALGCLFGGLFTLGYLFAATWRGRRDARGLLLGCHAAGQS
jgi:hypothetical protein